MPEPMVRIPGEAVDPAGKELATPTEDLLVRLEQLPKEGTEAEVGPHGGNAAFR